MTRHGEPGPVEALGLTATRILLTDVLPFWAGTVDTELGGYRLNHDAEGRWRGPADRYLVTQARTLWHFSRLAPLGLAPREAADAGFRFLVEHLWDAEHGGFLWAVSADGAEATMPDKHLYGQAFALYALSEYARATGDREALELARTVFALIDEHAHDAELGGYRECFARDWQMPPAHRAGYLGVAPDRKLLNTHLHVLEALVALVEISDDELPRRRITELVDICSRTVVDPATGGCRDEFLPDWTPLTGPAFDRSSYGHDLENVALLQEASALGARDDELLERCRTICGNAIAHGWDDEHGGFFVSGPLGRPADRRDKVYWAQAEALHGLLRMWQATEEEAYLTYLTRTLAWVDTDQVDHEGGDWHATVTPDGDTMGDKADRWKDPYHQTRALLAVGALAAPAAT